MLHNRFTIVVFLCSTCLLGGASDSKADENQLAGNCWHDAGARYGVDPWLLYAIALQESSLQANAVNKNSNGSVDVGLMQINSFWFEELEKIGINESSLFDPCTSIHVGAWVLAQSIQVFGRNWRAVGAYNAGTAKNNKTEARRKAYAQRIIDRYYGIADGLRGNSSK